MLGYEMFVEHMLYSGGRSFKFGSIVDRNAMFWKATRKTVVVIRANYLDFFNTCLNEG
jgi:hypothetical protein